MVLRRDPGDKLDQCGMYFQDVWVRVCPAGVCVCVVCVCVCVCVCACGVKCE